MSIISLKDYTFTYPGADDDALQGISLEVKEGEVIGMIGSIGAGKTTLCMAIADLAPRIVGGETSGTLKVNVDHNEDNQQKIRPVGMVFESYGDQLVQLRVLDEVVTPLLNRGIEVKEAEKQGRELLEKAGLGGQNCEKKRIWEISEGQQERLAIAATLAMNPDILIFDSVLDKLDPWGQEQVRSIINELAGEKTLIIIEQDTDFLLQTVERLLVIDQGKIIANDSPDKILQDEELLKRADVNAPVPLRVARGIGLSGSPLTFEAFEKAINLEKNQPNSDPEKPRNNREKCLVRFENVTFCYSEETTVLKNVSLRLHEGEVHGIAGRTGAGKTTAMKHIAGLLKANSGKVMVCDMDAAQKNVAELALTVGTVLQNPNHQLSEKTVKDEILFPLKERQKKKSKDKKTWDDRLSQVCELVGIESELLDKDPMLLPRGQRKLVTIASALIVDPKILLLDEPIIGLGATSRQKVYQLINRLRQQGKAVLIVDNDVEFITDVVDTVTVLDSGKVVLQGELHEVFSRDNWEKLQDLYLMPPKAAQLAQRLGINALTCDELITKLSSIKY